MSLRPPATVPSAEVEFNSLNSSERYNPIDPLSAKRIPALLPSVKPSGTSSLGDYLAHSALPQGGSWVITTTQTQIVVHSPSPEDAKPSQSNGRSSSEEWENTSPIGSENAALPTIDWQKYLYQLVILSLGAALGTMLHTYSGASVKPMLGSDRILAPQAMAPVLTEEAEAFIQKAQQKLYHRDRLDIQAQQQARVTPSGHFSETPDSSWENGEPRANLDRGDRSTMQLGATYLNVPPPPDWAMSGAIAAVPHSEQNLLYEIPAVNYPVTPSGTEKVLLTHIPPQLSRLMSDPRASLANLSVLRSEPAQGELIGLLEQGEESIALLKIQGTVQQVAVGDRVGNGMTFVGTTQGQAILELGDNRITMAVGQTF